MRLTTYRPLFAALTATTLLASACNCGTAEIESVPDEGPMPELRTGTLEPHALAPVRGKVVQRRVEPGATALAGEYLALELPPLGVPWRRGSRVVIAGHPKALAVLSEGRGSSEVLVRFPGVAPMRGSLKGRIFVEDDGWQEVAFECSFSSEGTEDEKLARRWARSFGERLRRDASRSRGAHPWHAFASRRLQDLADEREHRSGSPRRRVVRREGIARLMATTTGMVSLQEALQHDRELQIRDSETPAAVPIEALEPPPLSTHPYAEMLAFARAEPGAGSPPAEPLATATPAEFWYFRSESPATLGLLLRQADHWLIPGRRLVDEEAHRHDVVDRYKAQLGLTWTLTDILKISALSSEVALVGSDPYLREGSDVTAIFATRHGRRLGEAVARIRTRGHSTGPAPTHRTEAHAGRSVDVYEHSDGLRQYVTRLENHLVVSNSPTATTAVLESIDGKRDRLSDEPDFAYMRARDPQAHDAYFFLGDRFIAGVIGPAQKVLQSRRQRALAELLEPGYAALLYGWLNGSAPPTVRALLESKLLEESDLRHAGGEEIAFDLAVGAKSAWGRPDFLTPLIDLTPVVTVSEEEKGGYEAFVRGYQDNWSKTIDPVAAGLDVSRIDRGIELTMDARVIPVIEGTSYDDIRDVVADSYVTVPPGLPGLRFTWAIGKDTRIRRRADRLAAKLGGGADLGLGWLGGWIEVGVLDRRALAEVAAKLDDRIQLPSEDDAEGLARFSALSEAPLYVVAEVSNQAALVAVLAAARLAANATAPGMIEWGEHSKYRGHAIVEITGPKAGDTSPSVYYAIADDAIVAALTLDTLRAVLDRVTGKRMPSTGGPSQFVVDVAAGEGLALSSTLGWMLHAQALRAQPAALLDAEALLRGDPRPRTSAEFAAAARRTFGTVPVGADGSSDFQLKTIGAHSRTLGSEVQPQFPALPIDGSPAQSIVEHLKAFRAEVGFEREPGDADRESLHVRVTLRTQ